MRAVFAPALVMLASLAPVSPHDACDLPSHASPLPTTCPVPTPMLSFVQDGLRRDFREEIASTTVDPERDTPDGLREDGRREYAQAFGVNLVGFAFLTRPPAVVRDVTRRYGVLCHANGDVDHTLSPRSSMRAVFCGCSILECVSIPRSSQRNLLSLVDEP